MTKRVTSDSGSAVSLFPFLAVLLCTMGALLVLLVVLSQRAGERAVAEARLAEAAQAELEKASFEQSVDDEDQVVVELMDRLEEVQQQQEKLAAARAEAAQRLKAEQDKLAHLEEHTRRVELEMAKLHIASEQLKAAENKQAVDQQQAERELERLQAMIAEKEEQVQQLQDEAKGKRSYAIVQYHGQEGTSAPRIYIECSGKGVVVQPEGTTFDRIDFIAEEWPGNPLAKVVRATQQHLQAEARRAGKPSIEPVPLLIARPDGSRALMLARRALEAAEISFGFDFVGGDQPITYPTNVDPQLAQTQHHAQINARRELAAHLQAAPRQYYGRMQGIAAQNGSAGMGAGSGAEAIYDHLRRTDEPALGSANALGSATGGDRYTQGEEGGSVEPRYGDFADQTAPTGAAEGEATAGANSATANGTAKGGPFGEATNGTDPGGELAGSGGEDAQSQRAAGAGSSAASNATAAGSAGNPSQGAASTATGPTTNSMMAGQFNADSSKRQDGKSVQNTKSRRAAGSVPIQRPIQVIVRKDQFALLPSRHSSQRGIDKPGAVISMNQPPKKIGADLLVALREHMEDWGIAGQGLYWKPVISLKVGPDGVESAKRLAKMLANSGIEVRLPDETRVSRGEQSNATR